MQGRAGNGSSGSSVELKDLKTKVYNSKFKCYEKHAKIYCTAVDKEANERRKGRRLR